MAIKFKTIVICAGIASGAIAVNAGYAQSDFKIPFTYAKGKQLYDESCGSCHGVKLNGSDEGPPLVHAFYKPSHHGDRSFYRAALQGTKAHHWKFGDMAPVKGMTREKMDSIVPYIRFYQKQMKLF